MKIYIQGASALAHYRSSSATTGVEQCPASVLRLTDATSSLRDIENAPLWQLGIKTPAPDHPLEVLVANRSQRTRAKSVRARIWKAPLPPTAFRRARKDIYISSPEFLFLQMANCLDLAELAALGMELCGTYRRHVEVPLLGEDGFEYVTEYHQPPLTTPRRIHGFLKKMASAPGCGKALRALDFVLPNSASPMETCLFLLLCLPRRLGGYALPKPRLNPPIVIAKRGKKYTVRNSAKPDLYWEEQRLDLEYNSNEFHDESRRAADSMRRKALERMHVEVIELTTDELLSVDLFHATATRIASRLNKRIRPVGEGGFVNARADLRNRLLTPDNGVLPDAGRTDKAGKASSPDDPGAKDDNSWVDDVIAGDMAQENSDSGEFSDDSQAIEDIWDETDEGWEIEIDPDDPCPYEDGTYLEDDDIRVYGSRRES